MSIRFTCSQCSNFLSVPDEHAGKKARCPTCQEINTIPVATATLAANPDDSLPAPSAEIPPANPYAKPMEPNPADSPYASPLPHAAQFGMPGGYLLPHRGGSILTLGIMSLFCNFLMIPGIVAWVGGVSDLKKISAGQMDPSGRGTTQAGMITGIFGTILHGAFWLIALANM